MLNSMPDTLIKRPAAAHLSAAKKERKNRMGGVSKGRKKEERVA